MEATLEERLSEQAGRVARLLGEGCHPARLEQEVVALLAWFELWREASGLPDSGVWPEADSGRVGASPISTEIAKGGV
jgi:hypothetical protein